MTSDLVLACVHGYTTRLLFGPASHDTCPHDPRVHEAWLRGWDDADTLYVEGVADTQSKEEWVRSYLNLKEYDLGLQLQMRFCI